MTGEGSVYSFKAMRFMGSDTYCHCGDAADTETFYATGQLHAATVPCNRECEGEGFTNSQRGGTKLPYEIMSDYRSEMLRGCAQNGPDWKPVCSDPAKCKDDPNSIYLGQKGNIAEKDTWLDTCHMGWSETCKSGMPYGLVQHVDDFRQKQMCFYIGESNADGMCVLQRMTTPTHDWRGGVSP